MPQQRPIYYNIAITLFNLALSSMSDWFHLSWHVAADFNAWDLLVLVGLVHSLIQSFQPWMEWKRWKGNSQWNKYFLYPLLYHILSGFRFLVGNYYKIELGLWTWGFICKIQKFLPGIFGMVLGIPFLSPVTSSGLKYAWDN